MKMTLVSRWGLGDASVPWPIIRQVLESKLELEEFTGQKFYSVFESFFTQLLRQKKKIAFVCHLRGSMLTNKCCENKRKYQNIMHGKLVHKPS